MEIAPVSEICYTETQVLQYGYSRIMMIIVGPYTPGEFLQIPYTLFPEGLIIHCFMRQMMFGNAYRIRHFPGYLNNASSRRALT